MLGRRLHPRPLAFSSELERSLRGEPRWLPLLFTAALVAAVVLGGLVR